MVGLQVKRVGGHVVIYGREHAFGRPAVEVQRGQQESEGNGGVNCQSDCFLGMLNVFLVNGWGDEQQASVDDEVGLDLSGSGGHSHQGGDAPERNVLNLVLFDDMGHFLEVQGGEGVAFEGLEE